MFSREVYRGLALYLGEDELYTKIDCYPPFQFYHNKVYEVCIIDEGYLYYVFVLTPDGEPVTYVPYYPGCLWSYWESLLRQDADVAAEPSPSRPTFVQYWIDRFRSKSARRNQIAKMFSQMGELLR